jgi:hypothetical protein
VVVAMVTEHSRGFWGGLVCVINSGGRFVTGR